MAKRNKKTLIDTAGDYEYSPSGYGKDLVRYIVPSGMSVIDFEHLVIDKIKSWTDYKRCPEFGLLEKHFKSGQDLSDRDYFYNNFGIRNYHHGEGAGLYYIFSKNVLKGRLAVSVENNVFSNLWNSYKGRRAIYKYAKYVVRSRLSLDLEKGCNDLNYIEFLEKKGFDVADILVTNTALSCLFYKYRFYLPEVVHNYMIAMMTTGDNYAASYFKMRKRDDKLIKNRLSVMDKNKTVGEVISSL
jgi:hypothetical protein